MKTPNRLQATPPRAPGAFALVLGAALLALGCSDGGAGSARDEDDGTAPVYAVTSEIFDADGNRSVYVELKPSLEIGEIDLDRAREFHGVANIAGLGGRLFVSDGENPIITQYSITDELEWIERGR